TLYRATTRMRGGAVRPAPLRTLASATGLGGRVRSLSRRDDRPVRALDRPGECVAVQIELAGVQVGRPADGIAFDLDVRRVREIDRPMERVPRACDDAEDELSGVPD